jgi:UDP-3-O-[3-hydroxymyristoyl] glucosamine N-acyltransferase
MTMKNDNFDTTATNLLEHFSSLLAPIPGFMSAAEFGPVRTISSQEDPKAQSLVFLGDPDFAPKVLAALPIAVVVPDSHADALGAMVPTQLKKRIFALKTPNTYFAMAVVGQKLFPVSKLTYQIGQSSIHPTAVVDTQVKIGSDCIIGPGVVIARGSEIGDRTFIGAQCFVGPDCKIGTDCVIHPQVYIAHECVLGNRVEIHPQCTIGTEGFGYASDKNRNSTRIPHRGRVVIEDDVHLGAAVNVDRGTFADVRIGRGTKIDNHCHLAHNTLIGENCLLTAGFLTAGSTTIGNNCTFGGRTSLNGHIQIANNTTIAPISGVERSITEPGQTLGGYPVLPFREHLKTQSSLASLPKMRKQITKILKHLGLDAE